MLPAARPTPSRRARGSAVDKSPLAGDRRLTSPPFFLSDGMPSIPAEETGFADPAPKAQPPRKRSGQRTARELALWKATGATRVPSTDGGNFGRPKGSRGKSLRSRDRGGAER